MIKDRFLAGILFGWLTVVGIGACMAGDWGLGISFIVIAFLC